MTRFTKRLYRKARSVSIQRIMNASAWWEHTQHPAYSREVRQAALDAYDYEVRLGTAIVARGRRERGLWNL